jgi:hypothetical protein
MVVEHYLILCRAAHGDGVEIVRVVDGAGARAMEQIEF